MARGFQKLPIFKADDEACIRLKEVLDLKDLRDGKSVEFEVDESQLNKNESEEETDIRCFGKNLVASNICLMSDEEDESDEDTDGEEHFTEMQLLQKRMLKNNDADVTPKKDGGVLKQIKTPGVGDVIPEGALVRIHYNAYLDVGQPPYDSSILRGEETKLRLGKGKCILGLELAVLSMKKRESSRFLIRHDYAYGKMGCPPRIPGETTLVFDVEVLSFIEQDGVDDYYSMSPDERRAKLTYTNIEKVVMSEKAEAKEYFDRKYYLKAFGKYKHAVSVLENYHLKNEEEEREWKKQLQILYVNTAICCHHLKYFGHTVTYCNQALNFDWKCIKAHYFKGKALHSLGSFEDAKKSLLQARSLDPSNTMVSKALHNLAKSLKEHMVFEKNMCQKMFSRSPAAAEASSSVKQEESKEGEDEFNKGDHGTCSSNFRTLVKEQFEKFSKDSTMMEMPFPQILMTPAEIECILETAASLGMNVKQKGTGSSLCYEVYKKKIPT